MTILARRQTDPVNNQQIDCHTTRSFIKIRVTYESLAIMIILSYILILLDLSVKRKPCVVLVPI